MRSDLAATLREKTYTYRHRVSAPMPRHRLRLQKLSTTVGADSNAILAATTQLRRAVGYELTTTDEIAERAGVAEAVQDHRFPSSAWQTER